MKKAMWSTASCLLALSLIGLSGCNKTGGDVKLENDEQKAIYAIGHDMGTKLQSIQITDAERKYLDAGLNDGLTSKPSKVEMKDAFPLITNLIRTRGEKVKEAEAGEAKAFMEKAAKEEGVVKLESGIIMKTLKEGDGPSPSETDEVKVHYHGTLRDGKVFDSSVDRKEPATFALNRVIPCWTEGVQKMKVGGKAKLYCPADRAYGDRGAPPDIKPGAALTFEVELLEITNKGGGAAPGEKAAEKPAKEKAG